MTKHSAVHRLESALSGCAPPTGIVGLAHAIVAAPPPQGCETCLVELPVYADAVLSGGEGVPRWRPVHFHLLLCDECGLLFGELLDAVRVQLAAGTPTLPGVLPNLDFLKEGR